MNDTTEPVEDTTEAEAPSGGAEQVPAPVEEDAPEGAHELGDAGKKALDAMKSKWRTERDKRRELEAKLSETDQAQPDEDAVLRAAEAVTAQANRRVLRSEIRAAAAGKLTDPKDALKFLDLDDFQVNDDGDVDADAITEAVEDLVKNKPYLAAQSGSRPRFEGTADSGARKGTGATQLTRDDIKRMSPHQIMKAKAEGRLKDLMGTDNR
ncbi:hypothetical protein [Nocardiopsis salina]|uniref:hypothetical protein n=1 Tax=Nocardiopsis salina TaxID=245836 RepID=UPI000347AA60|nr:hypothetical protein [Nocardiopsis salina]